MTGPDDGQQADVEAARVLADRLLEAHRRVRTADLAPEDKGRVTRRLLALSDASKHDVGRASARLDALLADLDAGRVAPGD